jgi:hypothetical protein
MAVVLARQVADCLCPTGGTEHRVTETLSGIHLFKSNINTEHHHRLNAGITRRKDASSSVVIEGLSTVNDGVSASVMGTTNARTSAWDDELADNACREHKERTDFSGRYFAAKDSRCSQEASVGPNVSHKASEIQIYYLPKAWVTCNQEIFTIKEASDKMSRNFFFHHR